MSQAYKPELKFLGLSKDKKSLEYSCNAQTCGYYIPGARKGRMLIVVGCTNPNLLVDDDCPVSARCLTFESRAETPCREPMSALQPYTHSGNTSDTTKSHDKLT